MNLLQAMHSRPDGSDGRKSQTIWVLREDYSIGEYVGWECEDANGNNIDYWWCPEYGYSVSVGKDGNGFTSREEALDAQAIRVSKEVARLKELVRSS